MLKIVLINIVTNVAKIIPIIVGRMPFNVAFTPANFIKFLASVAINKIITKEGITIRKKSISPILLIVFSGGLGLLMYSGLF